MFDINGQEFVLLLLIALVVVGPDRLPRYAREFRGWVEKARDMFADARVSVRDEMGDTMDLSTLDPRSYDPRHIVRDVLAEPVVAPSSPRSEGRAARRRSARSAADAPPPFDDDAT